MADGNSFFFLSLCAICSNCVFLVMCKNHFTSEEFLIKNEKYVFRHSELRSITKSIPDKINSDFRTDCSISVS